MMLPRRTLKTTTLSMYALLYLYSSLLNSYQVYLWIVMIRESAFVIVIRFMFDRISACTNRQPPSPPMSKLVPNALLPSLLLSLLVAPILPLIVLSLRELIIAILDCLFVLILIVYSTKKSRVELSPEIGDVHDDGEDAPYNSNEDDNYSTGQGVLLKSNVYHNDHEVFTITYIFFFSFLFFFFIVIFIFLMDNA